MITEIIVGLWCCRNIVMDIVNEFQEMQCIHVQQCVHVQREVFSCCGHNYIRIMEGSINYSGTNYTVSGLRVIHRAY